MPPILGQRCADDGKNGFVNYAADPWAGNLAKPEQLDRCRSATTPLSPSPVPAAGTAGTLALLAEYYRHPQRVTPTLFRQQLPTHPVPRRQLIGDAAPGGWRQYGAVAGFLRRDVGVRAQRVECPSTGVSALPWGRRRCWRWPPQSWRRPRSWPTITWWSLSTTVLYAWRTETSIGDPAPPIAPPTPSVCLSVRSRHGLSDLLQHPPERPTPWASSPRLSRPYRRSSSSSAACARRSNSATSAANCADLSFIRP